MAHLPTDPYKGVRDFYPEDMAVQRYIFETWSNVAESFGFERYDASILEPSNLYKSKGAENEEMVNEQTYTFTDRGDREVTLRPEMTPTVARMIAGKRRELSFPVRWYSIPNLFRYERTQRGRLREHWQLNCDIFGTNELAADVEIIALAHRLLTDFGATEEMFEIRINNRQIMTDWFAKRYNVTDPKVIQQINQTLDRKRKITEAVFANEIESILKDRDKIELFLNDLKMEEDDFIHLLETELNNSVLIQTKTVLKTLNITNVTFDPTIIRGFNYYTGIVFEVFDTHPENRRSLLGGGRYDNLTALFGGEAIAGVGFGMGDVTMRDFLETHGLPTTGGTAALALVVIPADLAFALEAERIADTFRRAGASAAVDLSSRKLGKQIAAADERGARFALIFGENELQANTFALKNLKTGEEQSGTLANLVDSL